METDNSGSEKQRIQPVTASSPVEDWDDPNNAENPLNWKIGKKMYHTAIPSLFAFVVFVFQFL
jgi:hypothetical protein